LNVRELLDAYLAHCVADNVQGEEARWHRSYIFRLFKAAYGGMAVSEMRAHHLADFIAARPRWKSTATKKGAADAVKAAWNWAIDEDRIAGPNPFRKIRFANAEPRPAFPDDAYRMLCDVSNKRYERAVRFLRLTACRCSELCRLTWPDVDLERGLVTIHQHKSKRYTCKPKQIPLVKEAVALLRSIKAVQAPGYDGVVFLNTKDKPWNRRLLSQNLSRMKARYGIDVKAGLHGLRRQLAQTAANAGAPMKMISLQLGHASSAFTEKHYAATGYATENIRAAAALGQPAPDA
jgi:integrase